MKFIMRHLPVTGVSAKGSYWDDGFAKTTPAVALEIFETIVNLQPKTNLGAQLDKCHINAPNEEVAQECRNLFTRFPKIRIHASMNLNFLKTPVGTDQFVGAETQTQNS